jgi:histidinol-phosphate aminotransferase
MIPPKKAVQEMEPYDPPLEERRGLLRLDFNENTVGPSPKVLESLSKMNDEDLAAYPEYTKFSAKLARYLRTSPSKLMLTNASDEAIKTIFDTYIEKGEEIILPTPTFPMFRIYAEVAEAKIKQILYSKNLSFPTKKVLDAISKKTKIVVLVNPNNPTGTPIDKKDIIKIIEKAKNSLVILDEAYFQYSEETCISLIDKYDNLVIVQTFSKAFGLGGLRLGYIISNEENIKNLKKVNSPYSVNTAALVAASTALNDDEYMKWYLSEVKKGRKLIYEELKKLRIKTFPTTGNFLIAYFGKKSKEIQDALKEKGILVRDRSSYPLLDGCLRIGIGTKNQVKQLIDALKEILGK